MIKIAMLGAGRIGNVHCESIQTRIPNAEVKWVFDAKLEFAKKLAEKWNIKNATDKIEDVLNDKEVVAAIIGTPTMTHIEYIKKLAAAKKHIFCEKPIDFDVIKIAEALEIVKKANLKMQVGFNRRFDHNFLEVHNRIANGELGRVHLIHIMSRDPDVAPMEYMKISGGIFIDMMIHDFDMAAYIMQSPITEVYATGNLVFEPKLKEFNDVDIAMVNLKFANGALGVIDNSRRTAYGYDQRLEVLGDKGVLKVENDADANVIITNDNLYNAKMKPQYFFLERYKNSFTYEMVKFIESIEQNKPVIASGEDGYRAVVIAKACDESLRTHKPVTIK